MGTSMERLTTTQARVLEFIERWFEQRGRAPSVREITRGLGLKSSSGVQYHVRARERRGLIDCGRARGGRIRIVRRSVQLADPRRELTGETERQVTEAPHRLVTATLPPPSREYLSRAELHDVEPAVALGVRVIQELDRLNAVGMPRDGARRHADGGLPSEARCARVGLFSSRSSPLVHSSGSSPPMNRRPQTSPASTSCSSASRNWAATGGIRFHEAISSTNHVVGVLKRPSHE